jgi:hypothetical protein
MADVMETANTVQVASTVEARVDAMSTTVTAGMAATVTAAMAAAMTAAMAATMTTASGRDGWAESCGSDRRSDGNSDDRSSKHGSVSSLSYPPGRDGRTAG